MNENLDCYSWDAGVADHGQTLRHDFQVFTGDGTTEYVPEHTSHDLGRIDQSRTMADKVKISISMIQHIWMNDSDNIIDMAVDNSYNTYVVGSWDGNRMVFPNAVGSHLFRQLRKEW